jgi:hypothetical protein
LAILARYPAGKNFLKFLNDSNNPARPATAATIPTKIKRNGFKSYRKLKKTKADQVGGAKAGTKLKPNITNATKRYCSTLQD